MDLSSFYRRMLDYKDIISTNVSTDLHGQLKNLSKEDIREIAKVVDATFQIGFMNMVESLQNLESRELQKKPQKKTTRRK